MKIVTILEHKDVVLYLVSRGLTEQYKKAKNHILEGRLSSALFKIRQPKEKKRYQFRINQKYRAFCHFSDPETLVVFEVSDHQDF